MAFTPFDFEKGIDFTALASASAGDHNTLIDGAHPSIDSANEGKSIILWSKDTALDTPSVPDADGQARWRQYLWLRIPYNDGVSTLYYWDNAFASDPTLLKWRIVSDITALTALVASLDADVSAVVATANNALTAANNANSLSAQALAAAQAAQTSANSALTAATQAAADAAEAQTTAESAQTAATNAATIASGAKTTADTTSANEIANRASRFRTGTIATAIAAGKFTGDVAHGFAGTPDIVIWRLICTIANLGYLANDEVPITSLTAEDSGDADYDLPIFVSGQDAQYIWLTFSNSVGTVKLQHKTSGQPTAWNAANWKVKAIAIRWPS